MISLFEAVQKVILYKRLLKIFIFLNVLVVATGLVAGIHHYLQAAELNQPIAWPLMVIAALTIIFGAILPSILIRRISAKATLAKQQLEQTARTWIAEYLRQAANYEEPFHNSDFWIQMLLLTVECASQYTRHPVAVWVAQMAPLLREEIKKAEKPKKRQRKTPNSRPSQS